MKKHEIILIPITILFFVFFFVSPSYSECENTPMNDLAYMESLAEQGNADAQYILGIFQKKEKEAVVWGDTSKYDEKALKWFTAAAKQNHIKAQAWLCARYWRLASSTENERTRPEATADPQDIKWCLNSAEHGHTGSAYLLGIIYKEGFGVERDYEKSYFWLQFSAHGKYVSKHLSPQQIEALDKKAKEWKPRTPVVRGLSPISHEERRAETSWDEVPINAAGLLCGGETRDCKIADTCGNLTAIICGGYQKYWIADTVTKRIVSKCTPVNEDCRNLVPESWTCASPKNMPLSQQEQKAFPGYADAISCGEVFGIDNNSAGDGPYYFVDKKTRKTIESCSFWQGECIPPKAWSCGRPSNYGG
ncbi:MAG TPA: tetratricopeptide repeat protein [Alphaproteobacteria bacterium]|nr:tetratricopeptide repeat protein [Alphaproteobacteria bacterium]